MDSDNHSPLLLEECLQLELDLEPTAPLPDDSPRFSTTVGRQLHVEARLHNGSVYSHIGKRPTNEDRFATYEGSEYSLFAIYDGHGGQQISELLQRRMLPVLAARLDDGANFTEAISEAMAQLDQEASNLQNSVEDCLGGSTVLICLLTRGEVYTANLGDSQALLIGPNGNRQYLNRRHTLSDPEEYQRVVQCGGAVIRRGSTYRLGGELALSRSIGDIRFKPYLSSIPEISCFRAPSDSILVMASDGFWDENISAELESLTRSCTNHPARFLYESLPMRPRDNATIVCVRL